MRALCAGLGVKPVGQNVVGYNAVFRGNREGNRFSSSFTPPRPRELAEDNTRRQICLWCEGAEETTRFPDPAAPNNPPLSVQGANRVQTAVP